MALPRLDIPLADVVRNRILTVERYAAALRFLGLKSGDVVMMRLDPGAPETIRVRQACGRVGAVLTEESCASSTFDGLLALAPPTLLIGRWGQEETLEALGERLDVGFVLTIGPGGEGSLDDFAVLADPSSESAFQISQPIRQSAKD